MNRRVVITGLGNISPSGNDLDTLWTNIVNGKSKTGMITKFDTTDFDIKIAAEVSNFDIKDYGFPFLLTRQLDTFTHYALAVTKLAIEDSQIDMDSIDKNKIGVFVGNCLGGVRFGERELYNLYLKGYKEVSPYQAISWFYAAPQGQISIYYKLKGFSKTVVADRISSDVAIGYAYRSIILNRIEAAFVCGTEAGIAPYGFLGFMKSGILSRNNDEASKAYRPYDLTRDGLVLGEGAGMLLLEELNHALKRKTKIYAEVIGFYSNCDGVHHKDFDGNGVGYKEAIIRCLEKASLTPNDIDYINLDGTALKEDDIVETRVLKEVFGKCIDNIALSCPKAMFGHTFGAAGAHDSIINCLVLKNNKIPPTINYEFRDKKCDLNYTPNKAIDKDVRTVLQIARGRGGINSALILKKFED